MSEKATLTVKDLADRLSPLYNKKARAHVLRQLKYWTTEGLLTPKGELSTGTGRNREYPESAVYRAALLLHLAPSRLSIGTLKFIMRDLDAPFRNDDIAIALAGKRSVFACFCTLIQPGIGSQKQTSRMAMVYAHEGELEDTIRGYDTHIATDLTNIFRKVQPQ